MSGNEPKQNRRNLWIIDQYASPPSVAGFPRQYDHALLLNRMGWNVRIVASPYNHKTHKMDREVSIARPILSQQEEEVDFSWVYTLPYTGNGIRRYLNMITFLLMSQFPKNGAGGPDVILGSSPHLLTALSAWIIARRRRVPFVFEVRDLWPESLIQLGLTNPVIIRPLKVIEQFLYGQADAIFALSEAIASDIRSRTVDPSKVIMVPNAAFKPQRITHEERSRIRDRHGWKNEEIVAMYAGAHGDANELSQIIEAAHNTVDRAPVVYVFVGDGPEKAPLIRQANGLQNVVFLDAVPKAQISVLLQAADIGLLTLKQLPLFKGVLPNKLFDYMGAGLPIISTVKGEAASVLEKAKSGVTIDVADLADSIVDLASDSYRRSQMGQASLDYVATTMNREDIAIEIERLFSCLVR